MTHLFCLQANVIPDNIVITFDVRLPPTTDLVEWEQMLLVSIIVLSVIMRLVMVNFSLITLKIELTTEHRAGWREQVRESPSRGFKR